MPTTPQQDMRERFEKEFVTKDNEDNAVVACAEDLDDRDGLSFWRDYKVLSFIDTEIDRAVAEERSRMMQAITSLEKNL